MHHSIQYYKSSNAHDDSSNNYRSSPIVSETTLTIAANTPFNAWSVNKAVVYSIGNIPAIPDILPCRTACLLLKISIIDGVSAKN